ncbi:MAG: biotin/lipoyl-binding protein [Gemmatimonadota bacterium]|nr:biotin/lipoyl-binding protein [Gemmatimonadota bacterium]
MPIQVLVAAPVSGTGAGAGGNTAVTANGYVVARTGAAVAAKLPGRIAELRVSEGSTLRRGEVIARLENADYQAQAAQTEAAVSTAGAELVEVRAERDMLAREARRLGDMRAQSPELVAEQEFDAAESRAVQAVAAEANRQFAQANLENTVIRASGSRTPPPSRRPSAR